MAARPEVLNEHADAVVAALEWCEAHRCRIDYVAPGCEVAITVGGGERHPAAYLRGNQTFRGSSLLDAVRLAQRNTP